MFDKIKFIIFEIGLFLSYLLGGFDDTIIFLIIATCLDYITGVIYAYHTKTLSSRVGYIGIVKKVLLFFIIAIAHQIDLAINMSNPLFRTSVCWFFISNECISLLENCYNLGIPIPIKLKEALQQIKEKEVFKNEQK